MLKAWLHYELYHYYIIRGQQEKVDKGEQIPASHIPEPTKT